MAADGSRHDLAVLLRSRVPLVVIETRDEDRARALVLDAARDNRPATPVFEWVVTEGLRRADVDLGGPQRFNAAPDQVLHWIRDGAVPGIYVLLDLHPYLTEPLSTRLLKDICQSYDRSPRTVVLVSHEVSLPAELEHLAARFEIAFPDRAERRAVVDDVAREWARTHGTPVRADEQSVAALVENLAGLSVADTRRLARAAIHDDGAVTPSDAPAVMRAKYDLLSRGGALSFEYDTAGMADLAGLARLKEWLARRKPAFDGTAPGLDPPKGLLLLGVQGCGKSLAAKVAAGIYGVPLLRLDLAAVQDKYQGESERKLREALATADVMAPCVVWIDEIEKGVATSDSDTGSSQRLLGTLLTWLSEKSGRVFVVATANDIEELPPELIRKGRFDEVFFVDLPRADVRAEVLRIHATRRDVRLEAHDVARLVEASEGFSGAELEQAVVSAAYAAHADGAPVAAAHVLAEIRATRPLSVVMAERVGALRAWAAERTVSAD
ncbi:AAA family ATPase [Actinotalea subterranea]|uniref:AAA family ATPase n=1 Tax=Actinotalea subterranea TaxID=2607497 RepID=UPI0011EDA6BE|nr:AAA family ATPase [Actinotalea subterranea]